MTNRISCHKKVKHAVILLRHVANDIRRSIKLRIYSFHTNFYYDLDVDLAIAVNLTF